MMTWCFGATGRAVKALGAGGAAVALSLALSTPAAAHIRVFGPDARPGQAATLQFRVPGEKPSAETVRVEVALPKGVALDSVPKKPGWTVRKSSTAITWTAGAGHAIEPDGHAYFSVRVGALPDRRSFAFPTIQTYSDGSQARWDQRPTGDEEPEFPAPVLEPGSAAAAVRPDTDAAPAEEPHAGEKPPRSDAPSQSGPDGAEPSGSSPAASERPGGSTAAAASAEQGGQREESDRSWAVPAGVAAVLIAAGLGVDVVRRRRRA